MEKFLAIPAALVSLGMLSVALAQAPSVKELMRTDIIPNSDRLFATGDRAPRTPQEWIALQTSLDALNRSAMRLRSMNTNVDWQGYGTTLSELAAQASTAARDQNLETLLDIGDKAYETCEGCHKHYLPK